MEANQVAPSPVAIGVRYGLIVAMAGIVVDFVVRMLHVSVLVYGILAGSLAFIIAVVGIVLAHRAFKQGNGGLMTIGQGVAIAVVMLLISSLLSALFNYVYVNYVDPDFVARMKEQMTDFMERSGVPEDQIAKNTDKLDDMNPSLPKALLKALGSGLIGGGLFGLIISLFTKRKPADFA